MGPEKRALKTGDCLIQVAFKTGLTVAPDKALFQEKTMTFFSFLHENYWYAFEASHWFSGFATSGRFNKDHLAITANFPKIFYYILNLVNNFSTTVVSLAFVGSLHHTE